MKFACWPVYFLGFLLSIVNAEIPYIPTAKKAVTGSFTPFARPLIVHLIVFLGTLGWVIYKRVVLVPESALLLTSERTWGMMAFAAIAVLMILGGLYAARESKYLKVADPWESVNLDRINKPS